ncbi:hypothetical protein [Lysinibacillus parviboronicapiens]|uniref:hypothetical protein n=1 Tax=Lysinibacillus parviboronicapiens TaxID=436516 RepID=UPI000D37AAC2|nr:hypothetical protein [Lysinibacillus parviboronicapiens]
MNVVHYYENKTAVLNQLLVRIPAIDEQIHIKGRKAKVVEIIKMDDHKYRVHVMFEKITKKQPLTKDLGKKKR